MHSFFSVFSKSIYQLCNDLDSLAYATHSVLQDFLADGVRYLELRTIPRASPTFAFTRTEYLTTVLTTIETFLSVHSPQISVYLILAIDRGNNTAADALSIIDLPSRTAPASSASISAATPRKATSRSTAPPSPKPKPTA
jgi:adenosine deaminase